MENKKVILKEKNSKDILEFEVGNGETLDIDINSTDQSNLRNLFYKIIQECLKEPFSFQLSIEDGYNKSLYIDVSQEYIKQLNIELNKILDEVPEELNAYSGKMRL